MRSDPSADRRLGVTSAGNDGASRLDLQLPDWRRRRPPSSAPHFVIQHHAATSDHYDFRLAVDDVLFVLGGAQGALDESEGQAHGPPHRGPSAGL